jgi:6-phosphogluconate dehydrogenase
MCPGGDISALKEVLPLLEKVAAKDKNEKPCVGIIGMGGAGHYVKMMHNGIEHGMMSAICEAWGIMRKMAMDYEEIGDVFRQWNSEGELVSPSSSAMIPSSVLTLYAERYISCRYRRRPVPQARLRSNLQTRSPTPTSRHL